MQYHAYQPVQGVLFADAEDFSEDVKKIRAIAEAIRAAPMPERIPVAKAELLLDRVFQISRNFSDQTERMVKDITNIFVSPRITFTQSSVHNDFLKKINPLVFDVIRPAKARGEATVPSNQLQRNVSSFLMSVVFGFEALQQIDEAKPFLIRNMPGTLSLFVSLGRAAELVSEFVFEPLKQALNAAGDSMKMLIEIIKWGSVAGGLYMLYKALEPKKGQS